MIDFDKYKLMINKVGRKVYVLWTDSIYLQIVDLLKDPEQLNVLDKLLTMHSRTLSQIRKEFSAELNTLSDDEFSEFEDSIEMIDDLISKIEYKTMAIDMIITSFNKLIDEIIDPKYSEESTDFIQEIPESHQPIKINRLLLS